MVPTAQEGSRSRRPNKRRAGARAVAALSDYHDSILMNER